jgi:hypothetical protein
MDNEKYSFLGFNFFSNYNDTKKANLNKKCNKYSYIVNITLLIINIILIFNIFIRYKDSNYVNDKFISQLGNNSLYNLFKYPQISIIISINENFNLYNNISLINFIINLRNQKLKDIELLFFLYNNNLNYYNTIKENSKNDNRIKIFYKNSGNIHNSLYLTFE